MRFLLSLPLVALVALACGSGFDKVAAAQQLTASIVERGLPLTAEESACIETKVAADLSTDDLKRATLKELSPPGATLVAKVLDGCVGDTTFEAALAKELDAQGILSKVMLACVSQQVAAAVSAGDWLSQSAKMANATTTAISSCRSA